VNVIKFDIEIKKSFWLKSDITIKSHVKTCLERELDFEGDFAKVISNEWNNLTCSNIKSLNSPNFLLGYLTSKNIRIFLFEKDSSSVRGRNNIAVEIIAFGDLSVEQILNQSFIKVRSVIKKANCNHINETRIFIYPYDSSEKDIYSYDLKVRANLKSVFKSDRNDYIRWGCMALAIFVTIILYIKTDGKTSEGATMLNVYLSIYVSAIFYLFTDLVLYLVLPFFRKRAFRNVEIADLSSVVETAQQFPNNEEELTIPQ
jgi:hypothetical protein